jgi:hypothetical protein
MPGDPLDPIGVYELDWENPADRNIPPNTATESAPNGWSPNEYRIQTWGFPVSLMPSLLGPVRCGCYSVRFELRRGDKEPPVWGARAELSAAEKARQPPFEPIGAERWYGFSIYLDVWDPDPQSAQIVTQWHHDYHDPNPPSQSPPLAMQTRNGIWEIGRWDQQQQQQINVPIDPPSAYQVRQWTDWVVHAKWSSGADGFLQIWKDGRSVHTYNGANSYPGYGNYIKIGIYKWDWGPHPKQPSQTSRRVMYHDELRIADGSDPDNYQRVVPRCFENPLRCFYLWGRPWECNFRPWWWRPGCKGWRTPF